MLSNLVSASSLRKIRCGHQPHVSAMFENWYSIRRRTNWTKRGTKYLGFHLQAKLPFRLMIDSQFIKLRKGYEIMKWIHRQFSASIRLIIRFWNTYLWPHLNMMATIYFLLSFTVQDRLQPSTEDVRDSLTVSLSALRRKFASTSTLRRSTKSSDDASQKGCRAYRFWAGIYQLCYKMEKLLQCSPRTLLIKET